MFFKHKSSQNRQEHQIELTQNYICYNKLFNHVNHRPQAICKTQIGVNGSWRYMTLND